MQMGLPNDNAIFGSCVPQAGPQWAQWAAESTCRVAEQGEEGPAHGSGLGEQRAQHHALCGASPGIRGHLTVQ